MSTHENDLVLPQEQGARSQTGKAFCLQLLSGMDWYTYFNVYALWENMGLGTKIAFSVISETMDHDRRIFSVIKRLVRETGWAHAPKYAISFVLTALVAGTTAAMAFLLGDVIDGIFVDRDYSALFLLSAAVFIVFLVRGLATFGQAVLLTQLSQEIVIELKMKLFEKVLSKEPRYFAGSSSSEMMMLIDRGAGSAMTLLNTLATAIGRDVFTLIALFSVLVYQNWILASLLLLAVPIIVLVVQRITKRVRNISRQQMEIGTNLSNQIRSCIQGIKVVKAFSLENLMKNTMYDSALELKKLGIKHAVISNRLAPLMEFIGGTAIAGFIAFGGWRVIETGAKPGELITFVFAALMVYDPARRLSQARAGIEGQLVGVRMMYDFLDRDQQEVMQSGMPSKALDVSKGEVQFQGVNFAYSPDKQVLQGVSFTAEAGRQTALVGRSGGGKTTIVNLLLRFWEPTEGQIFIDGQPINKASVRSLRDQISYVGQEGFLFDGSIRENIAAGRLDANFGEITAAAKAAEAHEFIVALPNGYDTHVGELGGNLSGGQRQRLSIARALLRDSPIVVLDEPTSALDGETERAIQKSLANLARARTTIVIAHRLSTIQSADQILVIDKGTIVERGKHGDLIRAGGPYARLYAD